MWQCFTLYFLSYTYIRVFNEQYKIMRAEERKEKMRHMIDRFAIFVSWIIGKRAKRKQLNYFYSMRNLHTYIFLYIYGMETFIHYDFVWKFDILAQTKWYLAYCLHSITIVVYISTCYSFALSGVLKSSDCAHKRHISKYYQGDR